MSPNVLVYRTFRRPYGEMCRRPRSGATQSIYVVESVEFHKLIATLLVSCKIINKNSTRALWHDIKTQKETSLFSFP